MFSLEDEVRSQKVSWQSPDDNVTVDDNKNPASYVMLPKEAHKCEIQPRQKTYHFIYMKKYYEDDS